MRFWDSSALVPLFVEESASPGTRVVREQDPDLVVWWATEVECASAIARRERKPGPFDAEAALMSLDRLKSAWREIPPSADIRVAARRLVRTYPLHAADALQLGAAIDLADGDPASLEIVALDLRLAATARREGFPVIEPT